jgi:aminoglycoside 2'-N-acetyltransferase I
MRAIADLVRQRFELGALSTGAWSFYARLGWERWRGPTFVRLADDTLRRSPDEDDGVMVLRCAASLGLDLTAAIACDERPGDSW